MPKMTLPMPTSGPPSMGKARSPHRLLHLRTAAPPPVLAADGFPISPWACTVRH
ncbi:hypothetical protein BGY98DRAFT_985268, partial [Russula aff. rugulosa BPL654]